jgi:DEAD/DEAH box helicase domain-containing protein
LLAIADRGDVGGISYTGHPQLGLPAVFIYDGMPGGAGLAEQGFRDLESLIGRTLELVRDCPCKDGCPGCIQSPNCGNGNKPLDNEAARLVLGAWAGKERLESFGVKPAENRDPRPLATLDLPRATEMDLNSKHKHGITRALNIEPATPVAETLPRPAPTHAPAPVATTENIVVFDLETQRSAEEVGGWAQSHRMGLALAVVHDLRRDVWRTYYESDVHRLLFDLVMADRVVGFNIDRFDLAVLSSYSDWDLGRIQTLDLLGEIRRQLGFAISLNKLSELNLGEGKAGDGLQSLRWWKEGRIDLIEQYCRKDVEMTRRLYELGHSQGYLLYRDHSERVVRVPVRW